MNHQTQDLLTRAQAILASSTRDYSEIGTVHKAITGVDYDCRPCNERRLLNTLETFVNQPERFALRIKEAAILMEQNTTTNYRFSKKATSNLIVLVDDNGQTIKVTPETLTDERAELVLKHKAFAHNIERIPGTEPDEEDLQEDSDKASETETGKHSDASGALAPNGNVIQMQAPVTEKAPESGTEPNEALTLEQARVRYHELTGNKAGTRNLKTLLTAIAEAEAPKA